MLFELHFPFRLFTKIPPWLPLHCLPSNREAVYAVVLTTFFLFPRTDLSFKSRYFWVFYPRLPPPLHFSGFNRPLPSPSFPFQFDNDAPPAVGGEPGLPRSSAFAIRPPSCYRPFKFFFSLHLVQVFVQPFCPFCTGFHLHAHAPPLFRLRPLSPW